MLFQTYAFSLYVKCFFVHTMEVREAQNGSATNIFQQILCSAEESHTGLERNES